MLEVAPFWKEVPPWLIGVGLFVAVTILGARFDRGTGAVLYKIDETERPIEVKSLRLQAETFKTLRNIQALLFVYHVPSRLWRALPMIPTEWRRRRDGHPLCSWPPARRGRRHQDAGGTGRTDRAGCRVLANRSRLDGREKSQSGAAQAHMRARRCRVKYISKYIYQIR